MFERTGENHPRFGIIPTNAFGFDANNPMYGQVTVTAITVYVYSSLDNSFITVFPLGRVASKAYSVSVSDWTILNYIRTGKVFKGLYILRNTSLDSSVI